MRRGLASAADPVAPRFRGVVAVVFPATHAVPVLAADEAPRLHGHDFRVELLFEATTLAYPGVVVDDVMRAQVADHIEKRLAYRDLNQLLDRPATCEAIAEYLAAWFTRSVSPAEHANLVSVTVTTANGGFGQLTLPPPQPWAPATRAT